MNESVLTIRGQEYVLPEVQLTGDHAVLDGEHLLSFSLSVAGEPEEQDKKAGLAINCIVVQGLSHLNELQGQTVSLGEGEPDPMNNELSESVIVEPGNTLELEHLVLRFDELTGDHIRVQLEAHCFRFARNKRERETRVSGCLWARVGKCRERLAL
jgi:hypothetical protein